MEFTVGRNYANVVVDESSSQRHLSVMVCPDDYQNIRYGGTISLQRATEAEDGYLSYFRKNPLYRERFEDSWVYTTNEKTIAAFVQGDVVYIVMLSPKEPLFIKRDACLFDGDFELSRFLIEKTQGTD